MNCLSDLLIVKRTYELGIDRSKEFQTEWREAEGEARTRCKRESINKNNCQRMIESIKKILLTKYVMEREVIPKINVEEEEIDQLVYSHRRFIISRQVSRQRKRKFPSSIPSKGLKKSFLFNGKGRMEANGQEKFKHYYSYPLILTYPDGLPEKTFCEAERFFNA
jgi:hypothetical protein